MSSKLANANANALGDENCYFEQAKINFFNRDWLKVSIFNLQVAVCAVGIS
jgi:hypothetical protein